MRLALEAKSARALALCGLRLSALLPTLPLSHQLCLIRLYMHNVRWRLVQLLLDTGASIQKISSSPYMWTFSPVFLLQKSRNQFQIEKWSCKGRVGNFQHGDVYLPKIWVLVLGCWVSWSSSCWFTRLTLDSFKIDLSLCWFQLHECVAYFDSTNCGSVFKCCWTACQWRGSWILHFGQSDFLILFFSYCLWRYRTAKKSTLFLDNLK